MNQKELNEIRRRFKLDKNAISKIYGCYVNSNREIISYIDASLGLMSQEEQEMYLGLLKKALSGTLGRNLIDIEFSTAQVSNSDEHRLLQTIRQTGLQDPNSRQGSDTAAVCAALLCAGAARRADAGRPGRRRGVCPGAGCRQRGLQADRVHPL